MKFFYQSISVANETWKGPIHSISRQILSSYSSAILLIHVASLRLRDTVKYRMRVLYFIEEFPIVPWHTITWHDNKIMRYVLSP